MNLVNFNKGCFILFVCLKCKCCPNLPANLTIVLTLFEQGHRKNKTKQKRTSKKPQHNGLHSISLFKLNKMRVSVPK